MKHPKTLRAFSKVEFTKAHAFLAARVATMMGRKFEEGDRSHVYHAAKGFPPSRSNLNIDVIHKSLGIEHKMLCVQSKKSIREHCGTSLMHPAATRAIRIPATEGDPTKIARDVLRQYADLIEQRRKRVAENARGAKPDMRVGWLLWRERLKEFLYFEQQMLAPNPEDYWAEWKESGGGTRKTGKNLWVYENRTGKKRYSITTAAGAKIQPYFDVPAPNNPNLYYFWVQGEELGAGVVRVWVTATTALVLKQILGNLNKDGLSSAIINAAQEVSNLKDEDRGTLRTGLDSAVPLLISRDAYMALTTAFAGVSDEHMIQLFVHHVAR